MQARPGAAGLTHEAARDEPGSARGGRGAKSRYAPGAVTAVTVTYQAGRTMVTIEDRVSGPQTTILADLGGTARAGPTADGWLVELEVPA